MYNAEWLTTFQTEPGEYIAKARATGISTFIGGSTLLNVPYVIDAALGYQSLHPDEPCYKKPDKPVVTPDPTETPTPETTTDPTPSPTPSATTTAVPTASNQSGGLAATGGELPFATAGVALIMLLVGGLALRAHRRSRNAA